MSAVVSNPVNSHIPVRIVVATDEPPDETDENLQGPFNWRQKLKPVQRSDSGGKHRRDERLEESRIRERLKALPSWKKDLVDRKTRGPMIAKPRSSYPYGSGAGSQSGLASGSPKFRRRRLPQPGESAFTRQVVHGHASGKPLSPALVRKRSMNGIGSSRIAQPVDKKLLANIPAPGSTRKIPSPNTLSIAGALNTEMTAEVMRKRVEKVKKARLYFLQKIGPNSFLIGGDSPEHKYRVKIGPQTCSCGKGPNCVHILFVMLRVLQVGQTNPSLFAKTLKNYEAEALLKKFEARRTSRINDMTKKRQRKCGTSTENEISTTGTEEKEEEKNTNSTQTEDGIPKDEEGETEESKNESEDEEETTCPICLLEMVEGESITECNSCQNKYHHHCISIWSEECHRQNETLFCPLCRATWKTDSNSSQVVTGEEMPVPPNTRAPSPQADMMEETLPRAEPISEENSTIARPWIAVLGEELVSCLFSRNWSVREQGLKQLSTQASGTLLLGVGDGRAGILLSPTRQSATHSMIECCCSIFAYICADPVYKIFVAALRTMRTVLSYTPCRDEIQQSRLQTYIRPVVHSILFKCADSNKRTSQLSISALQELIKGKEGELAIGSEIANPGELDIGGITYLLDCILDEDEDQQWKWQWLLGRLYVVDKLIEDAPEEFVTSSILRSISQEPDQQENEELVETWRNYTRVVQVLSFCCKVLTHPHTKVAKMAKRIFFILSKLQIQNKKVIKKITSLLDNVDLTVQNQMKRKLWKLTSEHHTSRRYMRAMAQEADGSQGDVSGSDQEEAPTTPVQSAESTPRNVSPAPADTPVKKPPEGEESSPPEAPPNTPDRGRHSSGTRSPVTTPVAGPNCIDSPIPVLDGEANFDSITLATSPECTGRSRQPLIVPSPRSTPPRDILFPRAKSHEELPPRLSREELPPRSTPPRDDVPTIAKPRMKTPPDSPRRCSTPIEISTKPRMKTPPDSPTTSTPIELNKPRLKTPPESPKRPSSPVEMVDACVGCSPPSTPPPGTDYFTPVTPIHSPISPVCEKEFQDASTATDDSEELLEPAYNRRRHRRRAMRGRRWREASTLENASSTELLTEDLSDLTDGLMSPNKPGEENVSFRTEVTGATSSGSEGSCHCKEEVEKEEAQALAAALGESEIVQSQLPFVPGLSREENDTVTIHVQGEDHVRRYMEGEEWLRGHKLGTGAFSTCYQARDIKTGTIMCVKQIAFCRNSMSEQETVMQTVRDEIEIMAKLNHPNIVRILGATQHMSHFFMFVEWMPGGSIAHLVRTYGHFKDEVITSYMQQVMRGLAYLHENHILHRDLKGANLLVDSTGHRVRIGDFGTAAKMASSQTAVNEFMGQLQGTYSYMAPEVLQGKHYGRSCDVWSVGCVIIEMATGKQPWDTDQVTNHLAMIYKIATTTEPPPIPDTLSPALKDLALRCLEVKPEDRPPAKELLKHPLFTMKGTNNRS